jgi:hypothetical protein
LVDRNRAPKAPARKIWLPLMVRVYHLQKAHPDAGEFRIWNFLARSEISVRSVGRIMALNKLVYDDIPHVPKRGGKRVPGPHPYKAGRHHQYWFLDGRQLDVRMDGAKWWSLVVLEGYSRTILAGAIVPTEATWAALRLFGRTEGVTLDPVYTGKAVAGMIGDVRSGFVKPGSTAVYVHTGGLPLIFDHNADVMPILS